MTNTKTLILSGLMIVLPTVLIFILNITFEKPFDSIFPFFAGIAFGAGFFIFAKALAERKNKQGNIVKPGA